MRSHCSLAVETASTQTKPTYAGFKSLESDGEGKKTRPSRRDVPPERLYKDLWIAYLNYTVVSCHRPRTKTITRIIERKIQSQVEPNQTPTKPKPKVNANK